MEITLLGVRGSTFVSDSPIFGGETSCFQIQAKGCAPLFVDAGSGLRAGGHALPKSGRCSILLTHVHWDHVWGLPFFAPLYRRGWSVDIYTPEPHDSIVQTLFDRVHFPLLQGDLAATIRVLRFTPGEQLELEGIVLQTMTVPHPGGCVGLRATADNVVAAFSGDCEINGHESDMEPLLHGAALAVVDGHYSDADYADFKGWGHSSRESWLPVAKKTGVGHLVFSHHNPLSSDAQLEEEERDITEQARLLGLRATLARQGRSHVIE